ncbi:MAG: Zn-ribbon domain-containing OB-fold protein [Anaerolineae bacterium]|nr:Zn-ribbon domain-containing OB-fold protein [Anaerolineae bacterium]
MSKKQVTSQIEIKQIEAGENDDWQAFRQVEIITLELTQQYKHSLGKYSRFFIELERGHFFGTRCPQCEKVYTPPRPLCPDCMCITEWHELAGTGTVETFSVMHFTSEINADVSHLATPVILAYVLLDGSSTLFPHVLKTKPENVQIGLRVQVTYSESPVQHPIHLMYFLPMEG